MTQPPDHPPATPGISNPEHRARQRERLASVSLRLAILRKLNERGISTPAEVGEALAMAADEAVKLLNRRNWREGDAAMLEAVAARLGVAVPGQ
jgi:hypothetical protein